MDQIRSDKPEGAPACARNADAGAPSGGAGPERRFSTRRTLAAVTRLLRGEPLETAARELNVTVARLSGSSGKSCGLGQEGDAGLATRTMAASPAPGEGMAVRV